MSGISDSLREFVNTRERYLRAIDRASLLYLADRIDKEMVELPVGADGRPIHVGDTVYADNDFSLGYKVSYIGFSDKGIAVGIKATGIDTYRSPAYITHERPDSLERIADEIEEAGVDGATGWAARIRALAGKGDGR